MGLVADQRGEGNNGRGEVGRVGEKGKDFWVLNLNKFERSLCLCGWPYGGLLRDK